MSSLQCPAPTVGRLVYQLYQEGKIKIKRGGEFVKAVSSSGSEIYIWDG